ncbi:hypothetical protein [Embleya sp. NPDC059259]|uniref:hypothetical protein n=1 Tax=unclassified Embleya TaxID=2699296 RepID=UPI00369380CF
MRAEAPALRSLRRLLDVLAAGPAQRGGAGSGAVSDAVRVRVEDGEVRVVPQSLLARPVPEVGLVRGPHGARGDRGDQT